MKNLKLIGARRFTSRPCGVKDVLAFNSIVEVTDRQADYLLTLTKTNASNNVMPLFEVTTETATEALSKTLTEQQRLAAAVREETAENAEAEATAAAKAKVEKAEAPAPVQKTRRRAKQAQ